MRPGSRVPRRTAGFAALVALAACAGPPPPPVRTVTAPPLGAAFDPGAAFAREREEQRRGIGIPPALPGPGAIDRLPGTLRAARPAPGVGPAGPPPPAPSNALSRLSAVPASPLANPGGGGFGSGRPW